MSQSNKDAIDLYEKYADDYLVSNTTKADNEARAKMLTERMADLPKDIEIFEVGSAGGNDAAFMKSLGFTNITVSDITPTFLEALKKRGFEPVQFDLTKDEFTGKYDFIYCWAVLMHLTKEEARAALKKMFGALKAGGKLLTCVKTGDAEEGMVDFRGSGDMIYYSYWTQEEFESYLRELGFREIHIWGYGSWLDCCAEK